MPVFGDFRRPVVVGHRGIRRSNFPGNTPDAFVRAAQEGATWVELDVRRSADDVAVVYHDGWTRDRVPIYALTADELGAEGIFRLDEILAGLPESLGVNIEVKNLPGQPDYHPDDVIVDAVAEVVAERRGDRPVLFSSFNPFTVAALSRRFPDDTVGLIHFDGIPLVNAIALAQEYDAALLSTHVNARDLDAEGIAAAHDAGLAVMVWTVNDAAVARRLAAAGADALCTDVPGEILAGLAATPPA